MKRLHRLSFVIGAFLVTIAGCQKTGTSASTTTPAKISESTAHADSESASEAQHVARATQRVALGGYCPVSLVESGKLVQGLPSLQYRYQGLVYQMASPSAASKFVTQPSLYVPAFPTYDPVELSETGLEQPGSLPIFALHRGKPWFFLGKARAR
jgi:hypothetical protein